MAPGAVGRFRHEERTARAQPTPGPEAAGVSERTVEDCHWGSAARISGRKSEKSKPACAQLRQCRVEHAAGQQREQPAPHTFDSKLLVRLQVQGPRKPCVPQATLLTSSSPPLSL